MAAIAEKSQLGVGKTAIDAPASGRPTRWDYLLYKSFREGLKTGLIRNDRQNTTGMKLSPKKAGKGGKYTWEGPDNEYYIPVALDEKDPNFDDEAAEDSEDQLDRSLATAAAAAAPPVEVPKLALEVVTSDK